METEKKFDAVKMMRKLRAEMNEKMKGKSYEEQRQYLDEHVAFRRSKQKALKSRKAV